jgi:hypothetical protein
MIYYTLIYSYDIIPNPHVKVDGNKISIVVRSFVRHSSSFASKKKEENESKNNLLLMSMDM